MSSPLHTSTRISSTARRSLMGRQWHGTPRQVGSSSHAWRRFTRPGPDDAQTPGESHRGRRILSIFQFNPFWSLRMHGPRHVPGPREALINSTSVCVIPGFFSPGKPFGELAEADRCTLQFLIIKSCTFLLLLSRSRYFFSPRHMESFQLLMKNSFLDRAVRVGA